MTRSSVFRRLPLRAGSGIPQGSGMLLDLLAAEFHRVLPDVPKTIAS
ncbi:hypothetical protein [Streptomyces sp. CB02923]|nr:hypothetical protein [Streptomyces sp. CB02923]